MIKKMFLISLFLFPIITNSLEITDNCKILIDEKINNKIIDNNENTYVNLDDNKIKINCNQDITGIYIIYELNSAKGTISNYQNKVNIGTNNFLHEYVDTNNILAKEYELTYESNVKISEISIYSNNDIPNNVEIWNTPHEKADLVLFSTHSDDEQLFFLGLIPTYIAKGANVQIVYYANHNNNSKRLHEQLHGLYAIGVRNYPIMGIIPDAWSETLEGALNNLKKANLTEDDAINFQVEMIRKFKPLVIVGHDENGEYSHGQHILNTYTLKKAILLANDSNYHKESFDKYNNWNTPKVYLHLYKENEIIMDYDTPLEYFNGKTAYEIAKTGYSMHESQQWTWFTNWINGKNNEYTKSTDIKTYSPNKYGLYKSDVGYDIEKNDMFENLTLRKDEIKEINQNENNKVTENKIDNKKQDIKYNQNYKFIYILGSIIMLILIILIIKKKLKK